MDPNDKTSFEMKKKPFQFLTTVKDNMKFLSKRQQDPQAQRRIIVSHVRVNVTQKDGNKTLSIPLTMHKIMNSLRDVDNKVTFEDIQRKPFSLETFPSAKATFDASFGTVIKEDGSTQVILGFTIKSSSTLRSIKQASHYARFTTPWNLYAPAPQHHLGAS
jgi:hypothetical protein